ncbi:glutamate ABC transporter substrate-binding protein [Corynebacterium sp. 153RC1]|uniref:glutamate ABC transporter substrate-binding protein n=1 Tax=unclassified Corynebacterium TaxID=2624378 RepID=UPI00211BEA37|nr:MULTISPECIES: glutamate ABC transporter substrate-binding protein [unclassified Corynebacterium]MCQ9370760.1 glutamate ABC transporter substrate-binding protein [Corynebacterium sp. 35RC1]MCQ9351569.1 glutamate ABC transporter substrate-binding protein [Corynebacterium sp. 209RC1]MCQ9353938.1 glutamate ABC transporter substrate-binding protein [Corynebacterium sp. 1222RC1]MCQ9355852.1 glutamate ABC transporter substrate-binding protein [Corynebacterium sp. 122RC1]MCQ9358096.1 glutamate ABC 
MSLNRTFATISTALIAATALVACGSDSSAGGDAGLLANIESGSVTLGTKYDQPGLGLRNADGSMSGLDVDVATYIVNHIAEENGWAAPTITWRETPSAQRETLIQNGEVDLIAATYSINKSRSESVNFGGPYLLTHQALLVRADDSSINTVEDLDNGRILCSVSGSTPAQKVKDALPGVQLQEYDTYSSCVEALLQGNVDALTTDATILNGYSQQNAGNFRLVEMFQPDGSAYTNEYYGVGVKKDDTAATDAVNKALEAMIASGELESAINTNLGSTDGITLGTPGDLSFIE